MYQREIQDERSAAPLARALRERRRLDDHATRLHVVAPARRRASDRRARNQKLALAAADILAALLALTVALTLLGDDRVQPLALVAIPLIVLVGKVTGLYERDEFVLNKRTLDEAPVLFQLATLYALLVWFAGPLIVEGHLGRDQGAALWLILFATMIACRKLARAWARGASSSERCAVIGSAADCDRIRAKIAANRAIGADVVVTIPVPTGRPGRRASDSPGEGWPRADLLRLVQDHDVERLILAPTMSDTGEMAELMRLANSVGLHVSLLPRMFEVVGSQVEFDELDGMTVLGIRRFELSRSSKIVKRLFDLAGASVALLVLAPVVALVAAAIRLDSRGPVFFRQPRIGRDGHVFWMFKFRTMVTDAEELKDGLRSRNEADGLFKIADDPRTTRVGRFLRQTSLDELPQLLNVLRGEMSLVGPRPLIAEEDQQVLGWDRRRLHLTPGMTGHWQILGSSRIPLREMVKIDYLYVTGWSLWTDVKILVRTVPYMLARRGL